MLLSLFPSHDRVRYAESGTCSVEFNSDGVRDGSGDGYTSRTGGTGTATLFTASGNLAARMDRIIGDTGTIPSNP